ncbi:MAG: hypothetical protein EHM12_10030, partial [Dehalococcoidia bacterium]
MTRQELKKIFYIEDINQNRVFPMLPAYDDDAKFHYWIEKNGIITELLAEPILGDYFSKIKQSENDYYFEFLDFFYQKLLIPDLEHIINSISNDIHNLSASLDQIDLFYKLSLLDEYKKDYQKFVLLKRYIITEIEYIFISCRSMYDLLQKIIRATWKRIKFIDTTSKKRELPTSFRECVISNEKLLSKDEITKKYLLSDKLSEYYVSEGQVFKKIRDFRVKIEHDGLTPDKIFISDNGFSIYSEYKSFKEFNIWKEETFLPNNLAPLKPILAYVIYSTINAMNKFVNAIEKEIIFMKKVAPEYKLFMRGPATSQL